ncbi:molybdenum cofactor guanylyltransferase [Aliarcobacter cryaerophilus ATCC 43158]|uniref:Probable molybdenum cofactor guanylyltransferase n=1 Tax=Aliarcobacter cryaerophilus ATCC 43158 TaxID=1032070 RepID=A0AAD0TYD3_9BACT|nr:molybdenum cofactor guanylyltransferase MobA [Aliarcobacter cryaerophilus]AYJ80923.1 molybdenum cofactor guanylyltransferase protein A [Aliarcobacter cryaerophilus ATCC 43158]PRM98415.1 molybdenum cofactor guanylyltransferase [Aliarcobacter cryaerophilus]QCZ23247.1 molybdenum cofactor guanylyltransferase [Aliarcobacter cryaerophilus ATCC 43158]
MNINPFEIPCVILSGGKSSRMGEDKSLLSFSSSNSLIEFQYKRLKPYFKDIFISSKIDKFDFLDDKTKLILDINQDIYSPILALQTILEKFDKVFIITVDTPFVKLETIEKLINSSNNFEITIAQTLEKTHNLCGVFSKNINTIISFMIKDDIHKINYLVKNSKYQIINFNNEDEFLNINDRKEYEKALNIIK